MCSVGWTKNSSFWKEDPHKESRCVWKGEELDLQYQSLLVFRQVIGWVNVGVDQLIVLVGCRVDQLTSSPIFTTRVNSLALPRLVHPMLHGARGGASSPTFIPAGLSHPHLYCQSQLYCVAQARCRGLLSWIPELVRERSYNIFCSYSFPSCNSSQILPTSPNYTLHVLSFPLSKQTPKENHEKKKLVRQKTLK